MANSKLQHDPSCMDDFDPNSLDPDQAISRILENIQPISEFTNTSVRDALGCVVAKEVYSKIDVPGHTNSAMDGYAINNRQLPTNGNAELKIAGTAWAGRPFEGKVTPKECIRIMTGAAMPEDTDTVVMQEHVKQNGDYITIDNKTRSGANVRQAGEDISKGEIVVDKGKVISPAELGLISSVGVSDINVFRKLRIAFFSTGDELMPVGSKLEKGQIYDSNRYTLFGMLTKLGVDVLDLGVIKDKREDIEQAFMEASEKADAVITSGGVSVGDADFVKETLEKLGNVNFWKVAMKPGRPLAFGKINDAWFFGLPGNPVSVMVTFYMFVQPALKKMMGMKSSELIHVQATCQSKLRKRPGRIEYQRGILRLENESYVVEKTGAQGSGILRSMSDANCFVILPLESTGVEIGDTVKVLPFEAIV